MKDNDKLGELREAISRQQSFKNYDFPDTEKDFLRVLYDFAFDEARGAIFLNKEAVLVSLGKLLDESVDKLKSEALAQIQADRINLGTLQQSIESGDFKELTWEKLHNESRP
jgi:hypothetical protein